MELLLYVGPMTSVVAGFDCSSSLIFHFQKWKISMQQLNDSPKFWRFDLQYLLQMHARMQIFGNVKMWKCA